MIFNLRYKEHYIAMFTRFKKPVRSLRSDITGWLYEQKISFVLDLMAATATIRIPDEKQAILFKLTWM